jgi:hypothetical protein
VTTSDHDLAQAIEATPEPMRRALDWVLGGGVYRDAETRFGPSRSAICAAVKRRGLRRARLRAWRAACGDTWRPMWDRHLERAGIETPTRTKGERAK